jgi:hypothetical protein
MKKWHCFNGQPEYDSFLAWAIEGSCLKQRMQESSGGTFEIPYHWFFWRGAFKLKEGGKLDEDFRELPDRLDLHSVPLPPSPDYPDYPEG